MIRMTKQNIGVGVHYMSLPEHPYYQERFGDFLVRVGIVEQERIPIMLHQPLK